MSTEVTKLEDILYLISQISYRRYSIPLEDLGMVSLIPLENTRTKAKLKDHCFKSTQASSERCRGGLGLIFWAWVGLGLHTLGLGFFGFQKITK
jgi:hypothetical protein